MSRGRRELKAMWKDPRMKELIDSLWREYYGLYTEKYKSTTELDELGVPIDQWLRNKISRDINFGQALGQDHLIEGNRSAGFGQGSNTKSFLETVLGAYNIIPVGQNAEEWIPTDLLLTLGNGPDADNRSNVFEIFKNGFFKFLQSIKIGAHPALAEGETPENGTLQWTPEKGLEIWDMDKWRPIGGVTVIENHTTLVNVTENIIYYDTTLLQFFTYVNNQWITIGGGGGGTLPDTVDSNTGNTVANGKHTHELGLISVENIKKIYPKYGALYNFWAANNARSISSSDNFAVPTMAQIQSLANFLGASNNYTSNSIGNKLRELGNKYWETPSEETATNEVGFNGRGNGTRTGGDFSGLMQYGHFWSSEQNNTSYGRYCGIYSAVDVMLCPSSGGSNKKTGMAVRLVNPLPTLAEGEIGSYTGNDLKIYATIVINGVEWTMPLFETKYRNGDWIHGYDGGNYTSIDNSTWDSLSTEAMCLYDDNPLNAIANDSITDHNSLEGKDGGDPDNNFFGHLTQEELEKLQNMPAEGVQGSQGNQGAQGGNGIDGNQGAQGNQGNQGASVTGSQGNQGAQGIQGSGNQGSQGNQGFQGQASTIQGAQGNQGAQGIQGAGSQGSQGNQGNQGNQGQQIATEDAKFTLLFDCPATMVGQQGKLPVVNSAQTAMEFKLPSEISGLQGAQGNQGNQGASVTGAQGSQGNQGNQGASVTGTQGNQGNQGDSVTGSQGNQGESVTGSQGNQGNQGNNGTDGNQGNQGNQGAIGLGNQVYFGVQGSQVTCTAQTITNIFTPIAVAPSTTYQYEAVIGLQAAAGTQGCQVGIQCSVAGATVEGVVSGPQTTAADKSYRQVAQGNGILPIQNIAGAQSVRLSGIIITPAGSPSIGVQVKGVQASQAWYAKANCYLKLTKTT